MTRMQMLVAAAALTMTAGLVSGCGDDSAKNDGESAPKDVGIGQETAGDSKRTVALAVAGSGKIDRIMYSVEEMTTEQNVALPWTKEITFDLEGAEKNVGRLVTLLPGSVKGTDGKFKAGACTIKVNGKVVSDNDGGKSAAGCKATVK